MTDKIIAELQSYRADPARLLALCIWREARGEPLAARVGVGKVVMNRIAMAPLEGFGNSIDANVLKTFAFSSFNVGDPNAMKFPTLDQVWQSCLAAAHQAMDPQALDPTHGAVFYFSPPLFGPPHSWGRVEFAAQIGQLSFYRIGERLSNAERA